MYGFSHNRGVVVAVDGVATLDMAGVVDCGGVCVAYCCY